MLYFKNSRRKNLNSININTTDTFIILAAMNEKLAIYAYIKYVKLKGNTLPQAKLAYKESYNIYKNENKNFNLINTYYPATYMKDNLLYRVILVKYNYLGLGCSFAKNIIIPRNAVTQILHKQLIHMSNPFFIKAKNSFNNHINIYTLCKAYEYIALYYSYWNNLFKHRKYYISFFSGILSDKENNSLPPYMKDITLGLISIEAVFEAKTLSNLYLIPSKLGVLNAVSLLYEEAVLNYFWKYSLYACANNTILSSTSITTSYLQLYEHKTSIVLPNNIITAGNYSVNILLLKIFSHNLSYYNQDQAVLLSQTVIFNLIVESLLKQYFRNGIAIPSIQFELIAKKMTSFVKINYIGDSALSENDIFDFNKLKILNYSLSLLGYKQLLYYPIALGITKSVLAGSGFLASISFQEIIKCLIKSSMEELTEWLTDLKSKIITTDLIETGSGWHRHFSKIKL